MQGCEDLNIFAQTLLNGGTVAVPTETVYGLSANALDDSAVAKIFKIKGRPLIDPLITHIYDFEQAKALADISAKYFNELTDKFWPGPLTVILKRKEPGASKLVSAGRETITLRMPGHPLFRELLKVAGIPLAAPSANPFGYVSPTKAEHVHRTLGDKIDGILDGGDCPIGLESTIVDLVSEPGKVLIRRPGPITQEDLASVVGMNNIAIYKPKPQQGIAPGEMDSHYSPKAKVYLFGSEKPIKAQERATIIYLQRPKGPVNKNTYWLSESGDLNEAAHNLFNLVQTLDQEGHTEIWVECPEDKGIGVAINDRLKRAAG